MCVSPPRSGHLPFSLSLLLRLGWRVVRTWYRTNHRKQEAFYDNALPSGGPFKAVGHTVSSIAHDQLQKSIISCASCPFHQETSAAHLRLQPSRRRACSTAHRTNLEKVQRCRVPTGLRRCSTYRINEVIGSERRGVFLSWLLGKVMDNRSRETHDRELSFQGQRNIWLAHTPLHAKPVVM